MAVLHRKNALFYKSRHGADCGDLIQSIAEAGRLDRVAVWSYLLDVMRNHQAIRANAFVVHSRRVTPAHTL
jgi:transposase